MANVSSVLEFMHICENLKTTKRTGWVNAKITNPESISDHMHRMGVLAMLIKDDTLNKDKCVKMSIVHDLGESLVGDITPFSGVSLEDKYQREKAAFINLCDKIDNKEAGDEILSLWLEYEEGKTPEALLVKDLDKFEMILQAYEYEKREGKRLESFFETTRGIFTHPVVLKWVEELYEQRSKLQYKE
ncbi:hypothetical protein BCR32DRAFT_286292 [Anaeromyces robustus]|uniref:5'-deoxynucleotidase n=1 Tax=Anaeromyces robustus TaxID=1754192 RepID=A0A1Y1VZJ9_9FUNG|nr:hypothetical protein BCR32DRAFT_286292 [Anaeromyces robustus]|eukprot:ORX66672.1 hypothetical protein BCR32DRAFT_286292 [Anaeromyces robustus]